jgi:hypothetical protein
LLDSWVPRTITSTVPSSIRSGLRPSANAKGFMPREPAPHQVGVPDAELPPVLLIVPNDAACRKAMALLRAHNLGFRTIPVSATASALPRQVPRLITTGRSLVGLQAIEAMLAPNVA